MHTKRAEIFHAHPRSPDAIEVMNHGKRIFNDTGHIALDGFREDGDRVIYHPYAVPPHIELRQAHLDTSFMRDGSSRLMAPQAIVSGTYVGPLSDLLITFLF